MTRDRPGEGVGMVLWNVALGFTMLWAAAGFFSLAWALATGDGWARLSVVPGVVLWSVATFWIVGGVALRRQRHREPLERP